MVSVQKLITNNVTARKNVPTANKIQILQYMQMKQAKQKKSKLGHRRNRENPKQGYLLSKYQ